MSFPLFKSAVISLDDSCSSKKILSWTDYLQTFILCFT